jgi:hypothetical protein
MQVLGKMGHQSVLLAGWQNASRQRLHGFQQTAESEQPDSLAKFIDRKNTSAQQIAG